MTFNDFCKTIFSLLEKEEIEVSESTNLKDELDIDSLQMVNLITTMADHFNIPFNLFIENVDKIQTVGGLYIIAKEGALK